MLPRERFQLAVNHQEADRVPILLGGTASKIYEPTMRQMMDFYGIAQDKLEYKAAGFRFVPVCEELYEALGVDVRMVHPSSYSKALLNAQMNSGVLLTRWGSKFEFNDKNGEWAQVGKEPPFREPDLGALREYQWPRPTSDLTAGLRQETLRLCAGGKNAIGVYRVLEAGIFTTAHTYLRGMENFLCDLIAEPEFAEEMLEGILQTQKSFYGAVIDEIGDLIDYIEIEDDLGMQDRPLINPDIYRSMIKPRHLELVSFIKSRCRPGTSVMIHSDGAVRDFMQDFIDVGIDILNPVQVGPKGMVLSEIKQEFGDRLVFDGGVDAQEPFLGSIDDVKDAVSRAIDALAPGGGFILGPTHNFSPDIPMEKILAMVEFAKEYGRY